MTPARLHILSLVASTAVVSVAAQAVIEQTVPLVVNEQQTMRPGYPIGNIAIGDPKIADFKVLPGRNELILLGRGSGQTTLMIWDQKNVKRHEIRLEVNTRQAMNVESELRALLKDFPAVTVTTLAGSLIISGAVSSKDDLAAIEKIAAAAKVRSVVRYVAPEGAAAAMTPAAARPAPGAAVAPAAMGRVHYDIEMLEVSSKFRGGSYATGIEPSGRSLFKGVVVASFNEEAEIFIGGPAATSGGDESGVRLTLRPALPDNRGRFRSSVLVETNLPIASDTYDPAVWRRSRLEFTSASAEPYGITGRELMATPDTGSGDSAVRTASRTATKVARLPGVSSAPGVQTVPVFGSLFGSSSYKKNQTQLLVLLRPRLMPPAQ